MPISDRILTDSCKFLTEEIIGAQYFNIVSKFFKMGVSRRIFCIFGP